MKGKFFKEKSHKAQMNIKKKNLKLINNQKKQELR